jgi:YjjG family noncanonical pyrimidine nucleotidase
VTAVKAVVFDLDHTLFDTDRTERRALKAVARAEGVVLGAHALDAYRTVNTHVWAEYWAGRLTSKELRVLRFHLWLQKLERDPARARRLAPLYLREFSARADLIDGARALVQSIARLDLRLGVVTNGIDRVQRTRLRVSALAGAFRVVVTSEKAGIAKPDPRIIELALRRLNVGPANALYVGDDPHVDGLVANRASVRFVWFNPRRETVKPGVAVRIDHQIERLQDLSELIARHR